MILQELLSRSRYLGTAHERSEDRRSILQTSSQYVDPIQDGVIFEIENYKLQNVAVSALELSFCFWHRLPVTKIFNLMFNSI